MFCNSVFHKIRSCLCSVIERLFSVINGLICDFYFNESLIYQLGIY